MAQPLLGFLAFAIGTVVVLTVPVLVIWALVQVLRILGFAVGGGVRLTGGLVKHVATFAVSEVRDSVQFAGGILTLGLIVPLTVASTLLLRFRAARHYAGAIEDEFTGALASLYRVGLGNPARFLGLGGLTDGIERRLPEIVNREPRTSKAAPTPFGSKRKRGRADVVSFEGYTVQEELQAGGSGARLFCAVPTDERAKSLGRRGLTVPQRVVIKAFDLGYGSTIPQIVRESRSLESAKNLGLILEHELGEGSFHYVMPYVPGDDLDQVTRHMHAASGPKGLKDRDLRSVIGYTRDLCDQLGRFHGEGLWHKDIKPSNLLVAGGRLQVVDFGLVTPLESALTLTTHGTEFFRDPELVRLALAGKRVKDVDGVKFDLYSAGAVVYSMIENSFPAHGSLSSISKRTPEALRWIVRRAMADVDKRYASAEEMARDVDVLVLSADPFNVKPADLPSVSGEAPRQERARFAGFKGADKSRAESDPLDAPADDVQRIHAFGMTAEIRGLGRAKESVSKFAAAHAPSTRKARKKAAAAEAKRAAEAARAARRDAKLSERKERRGMLRAGLTVAIFAGIIGGIVTLEEGRMESVAHARAERSQAGAQEDRFADALSFIGQDSDEDRYLEAAREALGEAFPRVDLDAMDFAPAPAGRNLHPSVERQIAELGGMARVLILTEPGDKQLQAEARSAARRLRTLGAIPMGVTAHGHMDNGDAVLPLLSEARYQIARSHGSLEKSRQRLVEFAEASHDVDAVFWLRRQPRSGYVRPFLAAGAKSGSSSAACEASDECETSACDSDPCEARATSSCTTRVSQ